jgi:predicted extracellular nuclease
VLTPRLIASAGALVLAACGGPAEPAAESESQCRVDQTPITAVQGERFSSPLEDSIVTVRGIVTRLEPGQGIYIEEAATAGAASRALFVASAPISQQLRTGQDLSIRGRVAELGSGWDTLTSLVDVDSYTICADAAALPQTQAMLPLGPEDREALEGMRLEFAAPLSLTDHYQMHRGEWTVSSGPPLRLPTEDAAPGADADALARENRERSIGIILPGPGLPALPAGTFVGPLRGVLGHHNQQQRLLLESTPRAAPSNPDGIEPPVPGRLRIVSLNLLNYFNGDGQGGGFPTARGAKTPSDFQAQQQRTAAAIERLQPHLLGVQELENDGFGPLGAAQSLLDLLNRTGNLDWAFIDPGVGTVGEDIITVGLFYRQQLLEPIGPAELLRGPPFDALSRVPMAQLFRIRSSGASLLVAVNHLKSKGRCPDSGPNADQGDGQGCWNRARVDAVNAILPWLDDLAEKFATRQVLIVGDMNAWRREDPIRAYREGGYVDLVEELSGLPQHSFLYFGQRGTLDYALASPALRAQARHAAIWHINADWPRELALPAPWLRMSDHDPVVVDFEFSQAATSD